MLLHLYATIALILQAPSALTPAKDSEPTASLRALALAKSTFDAAMERSTQSIQAALDGLEKKALDGYDREGFDEIARQREAFSHAGEWPQLVRDPAINAGVAQARATLESAYKQARDSLFRARLRANDLELEGEQKFFLSTSYIAPWHELLTAAEVNGGDGGWRRTARGLQSPDKSPSPELIVFSRFEQTLPQEYVVDCVALFEKPGCVLTLRAGAGTDRVCYAVPGPKSISSGGAGQPLGIRMIRSARRNVVEVDGVAQSVKIDCPVERESNGTDECFELGAVANAGVIVKSVRIKAIDSMPAAAEAIPAAIAKQESESKGLRELGWARVVRAKPTSDDVRDQEWRERVLATGLPWRVADNDTGVEFLLVPPGAYLRGASAGDTHAMGQEKPAHLVTITRPFYLGRCEVTRSQWSTVMGEQSSGNDSHPIANISFESMQKFCRESNGMRLPTEAEWEYACRAGSVEPRYGPLDEIAWYKDNSGGEVKAVGLMQPNAAGFHDMLGNVWEQCSDYVDWKYYGKCVEGVVDPRGPSSGDANIIRGSCAESGSPSEWCRASVRGFMKVGYSGPFNGFRVVRDP